MCRRRWASWVTVFSAFTRAPNALGADGDAERERLLLLAQSERAAGHDREALDAAERAAAIRSTSSLRRFIAEEQAALGRLAKAYESARQCASDATAEPPSPNHDAVFLGCRALEHELLPRIALLHIHYRGIPPAGLTIEKNGEPSALAERAQACDPGALAIVARAPGFARAELTLALAAGEQREIELALVPVARSALVAATESVAPRSSLAPPFAPHDHSLDWKPVVTIGLGAATLLASASLHLAANQRYDALKARCERAPCELGSSDQRATEQLDRWTNITLAGGLTAIAVGGGWLALEFNRRERHARTRVLVQTGGIGVAHEY